ncbi:terminase small subunit [Bradyrhizobium zhanjiangense]|uniref:terminase small subunit n=1 Tax=Bradyrhizobium zhanjiangense TaxID=1325107 RepID=UPI0010091BF6|nr:terminase small subunit [Bradyrhizobium zhanjiangense]
MALTAKQQRFVESYLLDLNATQAAIRAGYSKGTADKQGPRLLAHPDVIAAIDAAKLARSERTQVDADYLLRRLFEEAEADLADLYDENNNLKPIEEWPEIWRQGLVAGVEIDALYEGSGEDRRQVGHVKKIRLSDRLRRLELIGKHVGVNAFQDQVAMSGVEGLADRIARAKLRNGSDG